MVEFHFSYTQCTNNLLQIIFCRLIHFHIISVRDKLIQYVFVDHKFCYLLSLNSTFLKSVNYMDPLEKIIFAATFAFTASLFIIFYYIVSKIVLEIFIYIYAQLLAQVQIYDFKYFQSDELRTNIIFINGNRKWHTQFYHYSHCILSELTYLSNPNGKK